MIYYLTSILAKANFHLPLNIWFFSTWELVLKPEVSHNGRVYFPILLKLLFGFNSLLGKTDCLSMKITTPENNGHWFNMLQQRILVVVVALHCGQSIILMPYFSLSTQTAWNYQRRDLQWLPDSSPFDLFFPIICLYFIIFPL